LIGLGEGEVDESAEMMTEKELKLMQYLQLFKQLDGHVQCDPPNNFFKQFKGSVLFNNKFTPFNHTNSVFRGSVLEGQVLNLKFLYAFLFYSAPFFPKKEMQQKLL
jgi:hypothetical protein